MELVNKLNSTGMIYNHDYTIALKYELHNRLLIKYGKLDEAKANLDDGIIFTRNADILNVCFVLLTLKVRAHALLQELDKAEIYLRSADEIREAIYPVPFHLNYYMISKFILYYFRLKNALYKKNKKLITEITRELIVTKKALLTGASKAASDRVEAYRLVFNFYYLTGKYARAFKYIRRSIVEGEEKNARVELARTYRDAGKFLISDNNNYHEINGMSGMDYIEKSRELFKITGVENDQKEQKK
jgi:tetratricopeptide (TPR) repeat protein